MSRAPVTESISHKHLRTKARIAIIGIGARGLNVLERIIAYARHDVACVLEVYLFDPSLPGVGVHSVSQPDHLILNTVACQLTQFSDDSLRDAGPILAGPSFFEWMSEQHEAEPIEDRSATYKAIDPNAYYPRATFGKYLNWVFSYLKALAPKHVRIIHCQTSVDHITRVDNHRWRLVTGGGANEREVDFVFLTTGHSRKTPTAEDLELTSHVDRARAANPKLSIVLDPYPVKRTLASISAAHTVAVEGAGLTAFDVISELTLGRGGRFQHDGCHYVYRPSGNEPRILLISRSGLPLTARGVNEKGTHGQYKAKFLTADRVTKLRRQSPNGKLDFRRDVLPLLLLDMSYAYYFALVKSLRGLTAAMQFCNEFATAPDDETRKALISDRVAPEDRFSWERLTNPIPAEALRNRQGFRRWLLGYLKEDVRQAELGNNSSPVKAACDVLRDLRDTLRMVVDFGGLEEASHRWFFRTFVPVMNQLAVGPPKSRIQELIALIEAGIVQFDFGPRATCSLDRDRGRFCVTSQSFSGYTAAADVLIRARIAMPGPDEDQSPLMKQLYRDGLVRPFMNGSFRPGGIQVDRNLNVVTRDGLTSPTFWSLGTPTEGCKFYTFVVPRPGVNSTALVDAGRAVGRMMERIRHDASNDQPSDAPITADSLSADSFGVIGATALTEDVQCEPIGLS